MHTLHYIANRHTSGDVISLPVQTAYDMGPDSGYVMYQVTVLGHFEFVGVRIRILCDGFAVMGQDKVIGLKLSVSVTASKKRL